MHDFDPAVATHSDIQLRKQHFYTDKVVILKAQELKPAAFVELGRYFGTPASYYEPFGPAGNGGNGGTSTPIMGNGGNATAGGTGGCGGMGGM